LIAYFNLAKNLISLAGFNAI